MTYQEALQKWGRNLYGDNVTDVRLELDMEEDGYCDTCWYEYPVIRVSYMDGIIKHEDTIRDSSFSKFLQELVDVSRS